MPRHIFSGSKVNRDRRDAAFEKAVKEVQERKRKPVFLNNVSLQIFSHEPLTDAKLELLLEALTGPEYDVIIDRYAKNTDVTATAVALGCSKEFCK